MNEKIAVTNRTKVKRLPKRAAYERETIYKILDEAFVCHVGFAIDEQPFVIPTLYARREDNLIIHGSAASRMMKNLATEIDVCVTVTLIDGLVLARSAFHHSINYRSIVAFGKAKIISDEQEKFDALHLFTEKIVPERWSEIRPPNATELKATTVLSLPLNEASAKIRAGNPVDDEDDYEMNVWAGVLPLRMEKGEPVADDRLKSGVKIPRYISDYQRPKK